MYNFPQWTSRWGCDIIRRALSISTCCTSAVVLLKSSMYLEPMHSLCLVRALLASSSVEKRTKASPVALPSAWCTNSMPSSPSKTSTELSPARKNSSCKRAAEEPRYAREPYIRYPQYLVSGCSPGVFQPLSLRRTLVY